MVATLKSILFFLLGPKPKRTLVHTRPLPKTVYRRLPDPPTSATVQRWMWYIQRRFPNLQYEWMCKGERLYLRITAANVRHLAPLRHWLGGGMLTQNALVYAISL